MQFSKIKVQELISGNQATRMTDAAMLKLAIESQMAANNIVLVSLAGIDEISEEFVQASFGVLLNHYGANLFSLYVKIMMPHVEVPDLPFLGWDRNQRVQAAA